MSQEYFAEAPSREKIDLLRRYLDRYEEIKDLPEGFEFGISFLSWSFNCPRFLKAMLDYIVNQGIKVERRKLSNISEAYGSDTSIVVNCTGLGASNLGGVADPAVTPVRGQVVVVKAPHINENRMFWGKDFATYIIKRPYSNDQLILGGFLQHGDWTADTFQEQSDDILQRTTEAFPEILLQNPHGARIEDLEILRVIAGLRPGRKGGVRIEKELKNGKLLVHNYGAGGYGYQSGYAMGQEAASLALSATKL